MVWVQFPASVTGFLCVLRQPPSSAPWPTSSFLKQRSSSSLPEVCQEGEAYWCFWKTWMLQWGGPAWGLAWVGWASWQRRITHAFCILFVSEYRKWFPDLGRCCLLFFPFFWVFQTCFSWILALPVQRQAVGIFPVSRLSPHGLPLHSLSHSYLLDTHDPHKPNWIINAASVISWITQRSLDI